MLKQHQGIQMPKHTLCNHVHRGYNLKNRPKNTQKNPNTTNKNNKKNPTQLLEVILYLSSMKSKTQNANHITKMFLLQRTKSGWLRRRLVFCRLTPHKYLDITMQSFKSNGPYWHVPLFYSIVLIDERSLNVLPVQRYQLACKCWDST